LHSQNGDENCVQRNEINIVSIKLWPKKNSAVYNRYRIIFLQNM